jgi:hypothetical protein
LIQVVKTCSALSVQSPTLYFDRDTEMFPLHGHHRFWHRSSCSANPRGHNECPFWKIHIIPNASLLPVVVQGGAPLLQCFLDPSRKHPWPSVALKLTRSGAVHKSESGRHCNMTAPWQYMVYNTILRRWPEDIYKRFAKHHNLFSTTIAVLVRDCLSALLRPSSHSYSLPIDAANLPSSFSAPCACMSIASSHFHRIRPDLIWRLRENGGWKMLASLPFAPPSQVSAVQKIARVMPIPPGLSLYRGLGGNVSMPPSFYKTDENLCRGFAEWGFMSTTADRQVGAEAYVALQSSTPFFPISIPSCSHAAIGFHELCQVGATVQSSGKRSQPSPHVPDTGC